jgi:glycosyltransferase involved in cell wall biosynthesis
MMDDGVAVVVCTRDRPHFLGDLLDAVQASLRPHDELVVVDSASKTTESADLARARGVRVVRCERPGASIARNAGADATTRPVLAFTDDDCLPDPGWVTALAGDFAADDGVGFVTGQVLADVEGAAISVITDEHERRWASGDAVADMGHGANLAVLRAAFVSVGGFDEVLGAGGPFRGSEDKDLLWRLLEAGWTGRYDPGALVVHRQWRDRRSLLRLEFGYGLGGGAFAAKVAREGGGTRPLVGLLVKDLGTTLGHFVHGRRWAAACVGLRVTGGYVGALGSLTYRIDAGRLVSRDAVRRRALSRS